MIWFFTPYAHDKNFVTAIDKHFALVTNPEDWVVIMDGDTAFLRPDFGNVIKHYTEQFPKTGLFTCWASRCHYSCQVPPNVNMDSDSILYHRNIADQLSATYRGAAQILNRKIAGHLMVIKRSTWTLIREQVFALAASKHILGVDTKISKAILKNNLRIILMKELYLFHYLRLKEGFNSDQHLQP